MRIEKAPYENMRVWIKKSDGEVEVFDNPEYIDIEIQ